MRVVCNDVHNHGYTFHRLPGLPFSLIDRSKTVSLLNRKTYNLQSHHPHASIRISSTEERLLTNYADVEIWAEYDAKADEGSKYSCLITQLINEL